MYSVFWMIFQVLLIVMIAPFFDGIARILRAKMQSRKGPPDCFQTYRDLLKLFKRNKTVPNCSHWVFRYAPYMLFATMASILAVLPIAYNSNPTAGVFSDIFVVIYLGAFFRFVFGVASLDSGNPFAGLGGEREQMSGVFVEPVAIICLIVVMLLAKTSNIVDIQNLVREGVIGYQTPAFAIASIAFLWVAYVETGRNPYDFAEAEQEILEGLLCEYSGSDLAILNITLMVRQFAMVGLFLVIFEPWNFQNPFLAVLVFVIETGFFYVTAVLIDNLGPRYKLLKGFQKNSKFALGIAFLALILYVAGV